MYGEYIEQLIAKHGTDPGELLPILEAIQAKYGYLPEEALRLLSDQMDISLVEIYGVATFYRAFSLQPRGTHLVSVCTGTACHVRGSPALVDKVEQTIHIRPGQTTPDRVLTLETVNCLGACAVGPVVVVDGHYFSHVGDEQVPRILEQAREGLDRVEIDTDKRIFPLDVSCPRCNHGLLDTETPIDGLPSIRVVVSVQRRHGSLRLSALYGSNAIASDHEIPIDAVLNFFCPHCHAALAGATNCSNCSAPMVPMAVKGGGMLQVCSRRGCREHRLDINGVNL